jgi:hypothetical protein
VGFWEALDRLPAAGGVRHNPAERFRPEPRALRVPLIADDGTRVPGCFTGPFRVNLVRVSRHRTVVPARPPAPAETRESLSAVLQVFAEPGLAINANGPPVLEEASDDRGQDLRPATPSPYPRPPLWPLRYDEGYLGMLQVQIPLRITEQPGRRIRRLKGYIPITVVAQADGPLVLPLAEAAGQWHSADGMDLRIMGVRREKEQTTILLSVRGEPPGPQPTVEFVAAPPGEFRPQFRFEDHIRILDDRGHPCLWYSGQQHREPGANLEVPLVVSKGDAGPPARVLYHDLVGATTEVAFEFVDQPLP